MLGGIFFAEELRVGKDRRHSFGRNIPAPSKMNEQCHKSAVSAVQCLSTFSHAIDQKNHQEFLSGC